MKYNSNNILRIEHFFHIPKNKGQKKDGKVTFLLKNVCLCYFSIPFSCILLLIRDLAALVKSTYFDSYWFILILYRKKRTQRNDL